MWTVAGSGHRLYRHPMLYPLSEKRPFFNGLLAVPGVAKNFRVIRVVRG
jgi:hypothetical protein